MKARTLVDAIYIDEKIERYIVDIIHATREPGEHRQEGESRRVWRSPEPPLH